MKMITMNMMILNLRVISKIRKGYQMEVKENCLIIL